MSTASRNGTSKPSSNRATGRPQKGSSYRFVVFDADEPWRNGLGDSVATAGPSTDELVHAIEHTTPRSLWISRTVEQTEELVQSLAAFFAEQRTGRRTLGDLLMLKAPPVRILPFLQGWFGRVIGETRHFRALPTDQLIDVLAAPDAERRDLFIGGVVDADLGTLALVRGDLDRVTVPLSLFRPSGKSAPNHRRFELDDYGHVLRFGNYEATADVVLWQLDPDYRRRVQAREREHARGFGASLRRLRIQRGLLQSDFPGVPRKTISRIEQGLVKKPRGKTLARLSQTLGVAPEEIESF